MCGIVAGFNKSKDINEEVLLQFEDQSSRGTNGFGMIFLDEKGKFSLARSTGQIKAIMNAYMTPSKMLIFHHRTPSSSKNKISQTHPILVSSGDLKHEYYFMHNGVIRNDDDRKKYHNEELGYEYSTDVEVDGWYDKKEMMSNDSEVLGYDIARFIEGQTKEIKTAGSAAFVMTQVDKKSQKVTKIFYGRNTGNPLKLAKSRDYIFLSSEGKGADIKEDMLYSFKPNDYKITKKKMVIPVTVPETKEEKAKKDEEEKVSANEATSYNHGGYHRDTYSSYENEDWMTFEEEEEVDKYFNAAQLELDNLRDLLKEAQSGEELFIFNTEDYVKEITRNLVLGVQYARDLKASEYVQDAMEADDEAEDAKAILEGETTEVEGFKVPSKTQSK